MNDKVRRALTESGVKYRELVFDEPFQTTAHAAVMMDTTIESLAKTIVFKNPDGGAIVVSMAGTAKIDNKKFQRKFKFRPTMMEADEMMELIGYTPGNVSPLGIASDDIKLYMDFSLFAFGNNTVYPSGGEESSSLAITAVDLYKAAKYISTVDVSK